MRIEFLGSFAQDLRRVRDRAVREQVRAAIQAAEEAREAEGIPGLRKLSASEPYFRIPVGDHCAGIRVEGDTVTFVRVLPRAELYCYLP